MEFNKKRKVWTVMKNLLKSPCSLTKVIDYDREYMDYFKEEYGEYLPLKVISPLDLVETFEVRVRPFISNFVGADNMTLSLLMALAREYTNCLFLEFGTYHGITARNMSRVAHVTTIDHMKYDRSVLGDLFRVEEVHADSNEVDLQFYRWHLIFVDGSTNFSQYKRDVTRAFEHLMEGGTIVFDDILNRSRQYEDPLWVRWKIVSALFDGCPPDLRGDLYLVAGTASMVYTTRKPSIDKEYADHKFGFNLGVVDVHD